MTAIADLSGAASSLFGDIFGRLLPAKIPRGRSNLLGPSRLLAKSAANVRSQPKKTVRAVFRVPSWGKPGRMGNDR